MLEEVALSAAITAVRNLFGLGWVLSLNDLFIYVLLEDIPSVQASPALISPMTILPEVATYTSFLK